MQGCPGVGKLGRDRAKSTKSHSPIEAFLTAIRLMEEQASPAAALPCPALLMTRSPLSLPLARGLNTLFTAWLGCRKSHPGDALLSPTAIGSLRIPWGQMLIGMGGSHLFWGTGPSRDARAPGHPPAVVLPSSLETSFYNCSDREWFLQQFLQL